MRQSSCPYSIHIMTFFEYIQRTMLSLLKQLLRILTLLGRNLYLERSKGLLMSRKSMIKIPTLEVCFVILSWNLFLLIDAQKQGNGLLTFLLQKKLHKSIQQSGHKNYAVSLLSYKHTVLAYPNAQFSHQFMWNTSAGRKGPGNKFPRDQKVEHLNRFLKDSFRSLGPNLNPLTARRINKRSDFGIKIEEKLTEFFELSQAGKSHSQKDHTVTVSKILGILRSESVTDMIPGRKFKGPNLQPNFFANFDEVKFRTWHFDKDKELYRSSKRYRS